MPKQTEVTVKEKVQECEECPQVAPLYLATFSDMAILLMAFFVLYVLYICGVNNITSIKLPIYPNTLKIVFI